MKQRSNVETRTWNPGLNWLGRLALFMLCADACTGQTVLGKHPKDVVVPNFLGQNGNANTVLTGLGAYGTVPLALPGGLTLGGVTRTTWPDEGSGGVTSFNMRDGDVTLTSGDVLGAVPGLLVNGAKGVTLEGTFLVHGELYFTNNGAMQEPRSSYIQWGTLGLTFRDNLLVGVGPSATAILTDGSASFAQGAATVSASGVFGGNGGGLYNLNADGLADGTVPRARLDGLTTTHVLQAGDIIVVENGLIVSITPP
jgi:hypothetical protein